MRYIIQSIQFLYSDFMQATQEKIIKCLYCFIDVRQLQLKEHLQDCLKKPVMSDRRIRIVSDKLSQQQIQMIIEDIDVSRQHLQNYLQSQLSGQELGYFGSAIRSSKKKQQAPSMNLETVKNNMVKCRKCSRQFYSSIDDHMLFFVEGCWHLFCNLCIVKYFEAQFVNSEGSLSCLVKGCKKRIQANRLINVVGQKKYIALEQKAIRKMMNVIQCQKCKNQFAFSPGGPEDAPKKDLNGKDLTMSQKIDYSKNRFMCLNAECKAQQCQSCKASPYHIGYSCEQFKYRSDTKKCRYCDEPLDSKNLFKTDVMAFKDICNSAQCQKLVKNACDKILNCQHPCSGIAGEIQCLPCLQQPCCSSNENLNGQTGDDYCNICFIEALTAAPCIRSSCGHIFHEHCISKRYKVKWLTPRIIFNFCHCPLCKQWIKVPPQNPLYEKIEENLKLFNKIEEMSLERLKFEELLKDKRLTDPQSLYYNKPNEYAMAIYAYFMCFKCKRPYFGGRRDCMAADPQQSFKPQELICPNCCQIPIQNCPKHGNTFIQFKCKFCCSIAQWFCWGKVHFCQPCHKKQCSGDYVSKYPKQKLPKCLGRGKCPIGGNHNGNGQEVSLGCAVCRNIKQNKKQF